MLVDVLLGLGLVYSLGYVVAAAYYLSLTADLGPPGLVGPFVWAARWPATLLGWADRPRE